MIEADLTPEHTLRGNAHDSDGPIHPEVAAADAYVCGLPDDCADAEISGAPAWHGWALREAFLAGCSHAKEPTAIPVPREMLERLQRDLAESGAAWKADYRDAARYRWLRAYAPQTVCREALQLGGDGQTSQDLDAAIDAAMKEPT